MGDDFYQVVHLRGDKKFIQFEKKYIDYDRQYFKKRLKLNNKNWKEEDKIRTIQEFKHFSHFEKKIKKNAAASQP